MPCNNQTAGVWGNDPSTTANVGSVPLDDYVRGDTWSGLYNIGPIWQDNAPQPYTLTSARITFRQAYDDAQAAYAFVSGTPGVNQGQMLILDAVNWILQVPPVILPLGVGLWLWDLELTDSAGNVHTWVRSTLNIIPDVSR